MALFEAIGGRITFLSARPPVWEGRTAMGKSAPSRAPAGCRTKNNESWTNIAMPSVGLLQAASRFRCRACALRLRTRKMLLDEVGIAEAVVLPGSMKAVVQTLFQPEQATLSYYGQACCIECMIYCHTDC